MVAVHSYKFGYQSGFFTDFISRLSWYTHLFKFVSGTILLLVFEHAVHTFSAINLQQNSSLISRKTFMSLPCNMLDIIAVRNEINPVHMFPHDVFNIILANAPSTYRWGGSFILFVLDNVEYRFVNLT